MTAEKSAEITKWVNENIAKLKLSEQAFCVAAIHEAMEKIEPIYDRYHESGQNGWNVYDAAKRLNGLMILGSDKGEGADGHSRQ